MKDHFKKITRVKPSSSRSESSELYLFCVGFLENEKTKSVFKQMKEGNKDTKDEVMSNEDKDNLAKLFQITKFSQGEDSQGNFFP